LDGLKAFLIKDPFKNQRDEINRTVGDDGAQLAELICTFDAFATCFAEFKEKTSLSIASIERHLTEAKKRRFCFKTTHCYSFNAWHHPFKFICLFDCDQREALIYELLIGEIFVVDC
jgi:hypothetical protein